MERSFVKTKPCSHSWPFVVEIGVLIFLSLVLNLLLSSSIRASEETACNDRHYVVHTPAERYVFSEVNRLRVERGLGVLKKNLKLQSAAREHSCEMSRLGYFSHDDFQGRDLKQRLAPFRLNWRSIAENIAKCQDSDPARTAVDGWLHSPGHKRNMLNPEFTETGVGAITNPNGEISFCQIFMTAGEKLPEFSK